MGTVPRRVLERRHAELRRLDGDAVRAGGPAAGARRLRRRGGPRRAARDHQRDDRPRSPDPRQQRPAQRRPGHAAGGVAVFQDITPAARPRAPEGRVPRGRLARPQDPGDDHQGPREPPPSRPRPGGRRAAAQIAEGLRSIDKSTAQLVRLVDELLDLTRLRMGHAIELDLGPTDLAEIVAPPGRRVPEDEPAPQISRDATSTGSSATGTRRASSGSSRTCCRTPSSTAPGQPDPHRRLEGRARRRRLGGPQRPDRGIGIPAAELDRVFEPYYRAATSPARSAARASGWPARATSSSSTAARSPSTASR